MCADTNLTSNAQTNHEVHGEKQRAIPDWLFTVLVSAANTLISCFFSVRSVASVIQLRFMDFIESTPISLSSLNFLGVLNGYSTLREGIRVLCGESVFKNLCAALAATLVLCAAQVHAAVPEKQKVVLAVGGKTTLYYLPLTIADQLGYFTDEGLHNVFVEKALEKNRR